MPAEIGDVFIEGLAPAHGVLELLAVLRCQQAAHGISGAIPAGEVEELADLGQGEAVILELLDAFQIYGVAGRVLPMGAVLAIRGFEETELLIIADSPVGHAEEGGEFSDAVGPVLNFARHLRIAPFTSGSRSGRFSALEYLHGQKLYCAAKILRREARTNMKKRFLPSLLVLAIFSVFVSAEKAPRICVFVPNVLSGSPTYEQMAAGAKRAIAEIPGASLKIVEAGFNQAEWLDKLSAVAATGEFDLIVSSNPSLPDLCAQVSALFPKARFFVADSWMPGNKSIHTVLYNQIEQGYIVGYLAGLAGAGKLGGAQATHKAGLVIAQHYPSLDKLIVPGFEQGLKAADPEARLETRVLGNWYDATKSSELAKGLFDAGAAAILPIAGGANQGVVSAAKAKGRYIVWFDDDSGYRIGAGAVIGCAVLRQERLVYERVKLLLAQGSSSSLYGKADIVGAREGYVDFSGDDASYRALPAAARESLEAQIAKLKSGVLAFPVSGL